MRRQLSGVRAERLSLEPTAQALLNSVGDNGRVSPAVAATIAEIHDRRDVTDMRHEVAQREASFDQLKQPATTSSGPSRRRGERPTTASCWGSGSACTWRSPPGRRAASSARSSSGPTAGSRVVTGSTPYGQGHETTWAMIVSDRTGIDMDLIDVVHGDTDLVERGGLTVGSRSVQLGGSAIAAATTRVGRRRSGPCRRAPGGGGRRRRARPRARHVPRAGHPRSVGVVGETWQREARRLRSHEFHDFTAEMPTFPSGAHVAVVEVDRETGRTELLRLIAADDAGTLINPLLAEGQVHGGAAQGVAQALLESIVYDEAGNLLTGNFMDYLGDLRGGAPVVRGGPPRDADVGERARGEGGRRVGDGRGDPGGLQRGDRRRVTPRGGGISKPP